MSSPSPKKTTNKAPIKLKKYSVIEKLEIICRDESQWRKLDQNCPRKGNE